MTEKLPPNLLRLFAPRPPLPYLPSIDKDFHERYGQHFSGVSQYLKSLSEGFDADYVATKSFEVERDEKLSAKKRKAEEKLLRETSTWKPHENKDATRDPFKTLFVGRLPHATTAQMLQKEFEYYGPLMDVCIVRNKLTGKSRGYSFIEFEHERDLKVALRETTGLRLDSRKILVDVEKGRTVKLWKPRRLGGGVGITRDGAPPTVSRPAPSTRDRTSFGGLDRDRPRFGPPSDLSANNIKGRGAFDRDGRGSGAFGGRPPFRGGGNVGGFDRERKPPYDGRSRSPRRSYQ